MRIRSLAAAFAAASAPGWALAADLHVSPSGVDADGGGSAAAPWKTLQFAADRVNPGDTVHVAPGSYAGFDLRRGGAPGSYVRFLADQGVTIDQPGAFGRGINVEGVDYVAVEGFRIQNMTDNCARAVEGKAIEFRRLTAVTCGTAGVDSGILIGCVDDFVVEDCDITGATEHGIYHGNSGDRPVIRRNKSHENARSGIQLNPDISIACERITHDGETSDALIEQNTIWEVGTGGGAALNLQGVKNAVIRNNLLYNNHATGLTLYHGDAAVSSTGNLFINNTVVMPSDGRWCVTIVEDSTGNTLLNNILVTSHSFRGTIGVEASSLAGLVSNNNVFNVERFSNNNDDPILDFNAWKALGYDSSSIIEPSLAAIFASPSGNDYHLAPASPAIDKGQASASVTSDLEGLARPAGAAFDVGAYESGGVPAGGAGGAAGGPGGSGGSPAAGQGGGPAAGSAGSGQGGSPAAGSAGSGEAGSPGGQGGSPGGSGGSPGGSGGSPAAGQGGAAAGSGPLSGNGGSPAAGAAGAGVAAGAGGAGAGQGGAAAGVGGSKAGSGQAGSAGSKAGAAGQGNAGAGAGAAAPAASEDDGGCGCRAAPAGAASGWAALPALLAALAGRRRRPR